MRRTTLKGKPEKKDIGVVDGRGPDHVIGTGGQGHETNAQDHVIAKDATEDDKAFVKTCYFENFISERGCFDVDFVSLFANQEL